MNANEIKGMGQDTPEEDVSCFPCYKSLTFATICMIRGPLLLFSGCVGPTRMFGAGSTTEAKRSDTAVTIPGCPRTCDPSAWGRLAGIRPPPNPKGKMSGSERVNISLSSRHRYAPRVPAPCEHRSPCGLGVDCVQRNPQGKTNGSDRVNIGTPLQQMRSKTSAIALRK